MQPAVRGNEPYSSGLPAKRFIGWRLFVYDLGEFFGIDRHAIAFGPLNKDEGQQHVRRWTIWESPHLTLNVV